MKKELTITDVFKPINDYLVVEEVKEESKSLLIISASQQETIDNKVYKVLAVGPNVEQGTTVKVGDLVLLPGMSRVPIVNFISDEHLLIRAHMVIGIVDPKYKEVKKQVKETLGTELLKAQPTKGLLNQLTNER